MKMKVKNISKFVLVYNNETIKPNYTFEIDSLMFNPALHQEVIEKPKKTKE
jgi:hypothetical protein